MRTFAFCMALWLSALCAFASSPALAEPVEEPVRILVLKEHGVGSPSLAQPYLDRFVATTARHNGWNDAKGQYYVTRTAAEGFIAEQKPWYGILSLAAFLEYRITYGLEVIGQVDVSLVGGQQYFLISKTASDLEGCKGKKLASDHADDHRFLEKVVFSGGFVLEDFELVPTRRPLQTIREVLLDRADCALIDDAQYAELAKLSGGSELKTAWSSRELPPMVVAAFPAAPTTERLRFQRNFERLCDEDERTACAEIGISSLDKASGADYAGVVADYGN